MDGIDEELTVSCAPLPSERSSMKLALARHRAMKPAPRVTLTERSGEMQFGVDHPDPAIGMNLLIEALGTADPDFLVGLLDQLVAVSSKDGRADERNLNFLLSMVKGAEPRDQFEAMLATQMAVIHVATMNIASQLNSAATVPQQESYANALNKLARTFATQVEALKRYRTGGEQKVTVQHVNVNEGGQAIVGNVQGGGGMSKKVKTTP